MYFLEIIKHVHMHVGSHVGIYTVLCPILDRPPASLHFFLVPVPAYSFSSQGISSVTDVRALGKPGVRLESRRHHLRGHVRPARRVIHDRDGRGGDGQIYHLVTWWCHVMARSAVGGGGVGSCVSGGNEEFPSRWVQGGHTAHVCITTCDAVTSSASLRMLRVTHRWLTTALAAPAGMYPSTSSRASSTRVRIVCKLSPPSGVAPSFALCVCASICE